MPHTRAGVAFHALLLNVKASFAAGHEPSVVVAAFTRKRKRTVAPGDTPELPDAGDEQETYESWLSAASASQVLRLLKRFVKEGAATETNVRVVAYLLKELHTEVGVVVDSVW